MGYTYPDPLSVDAAAVAAFLAARAAAPNIVPGAGELTPPAQDGASAYGKAFADAILSACGMQAVLSVNLSSNTGYPADWQDIPGSNVTFNAKVAKNFGVFGSINFAFLGGGTATGRIRVVINNLYTGVEQLAYLTTGYSIVSPSFMSMLKAPLHVGDNDIKMQWNVASNEFHVNGNCTAQYMVIG